jgi:hypothetical protein
MKLRTGVVGDCPASQERNVRKAAIYTGSRYAKGPTLVEITAHPSIMCGNNAIDKADGDLPQQDFGKQSMSSE